MKKYFLLMTLISGSVLFSDNALKSDCITAIESTESDQQVIDTQTLAEYLSSEISMIIVDARGGAWDDGRRIGNAISLPCDSPMEDIEQVLPSKEAQIVVYCTNSKCPASTYLAKRLSNAGYVNILKYEEGIEGWIEAGHEINENLKEI